MRVLWYPQTNAEATLVPLLEGIPSGRGQSVQTCCPKICALELQDVEPDEDSRSLVDIGLASPLFRVSTLSGGHRVSLSPDFLNTVRSWVSTMAEGLDCSRCSLDTSAFDLVPFDQLKPVGGRFSRAPGCGGLPASMPRLWMTVRIHITVRNVMRFRPPVVESIRLFPTSFSASMNRGYMFDPSVIYYRANGF